MKKLILLIFSVVLLSSCATNPVTGKKEFMIFSERYEVHLGEEINREIRKKYPLYDDEALERYVSSVGMKIAKVSHRSYLSFHFGVLDSPVPNAFALPGGFIYVYRGALALMNNEAQLAGVLGHEAGHVCARHAMKRLQLELGTKILFTAAYAAVGSRAVMDVTRVFLGIVFSGYSRKEEKQADELGVLYMWKAGYNPMEMSRFLAALLREEKYKPNFVEKIFATHPPTEERIVYTRRLAEGYIRESRGRKLKVLYNQFLRHLDGMPYGPGGREGYIKGRKYLNGHYGVTFQVPEGWKMERNGKSILFSSKNGLFKGVLDIGPLGMEISPIRYAEITEKEMGLSRRFGTFVYLSGRKVFEAEYIKGVFGSAKVIHAIYYTQGEWGLRLMFVYPRKYGGIGLEFFYGLKRHLRFLSEKERKKIPVYRIKIYSPSFGETFYDIAKKFYGSTKKANDLAVFNGFNSALDPIPPGRLIKIKPIIAEKLD